MPSVRRRLALTLPEDLEAVIFDLSDALGKPATKVVVDLLTEVIPQMQGIAKIARATKSGNKAAAKRALVHMIGDGMAELITIQQPDLFQSEKKTKKP